MLKILNFATTRLQLPVPLFQWNQGSYHILIIGGVHGDEPEGVALARALQSKLMENNPYQLKISLIAEFNPDGVLLKNRCNSNGVDLNRNLPTADWSPVAAQPRYNPGLAANSEPENQALVHFIEHQKPDVIISLHSWNPMLNVNSYVPQAEVIQKIINYKIVEDIGYPTPGSLGTYAGHERKIPTLTYEIQRDLPLNQVISEHLPALNAALDFSQNLKT